jgi:hypothetical protein
MVPPYGWAIYQATANSWGGIRHGIPWQATQGCSSPLSVLDAVFGSGLGLTSISLIKSSPTHDFAHRVPITGTPDMLQPEQRLQATLA